MSQCVVMFGGSFNPPTTGHINACKCIHDSVMQRGYKRVIVVMMPVSSAYNKPGIVSSEHRLKMCKIAVADYPECLDYLVVDDFEVTRSEWLRTINSLEYLRKKYPEAKVMMACGVDVVKTFEKAWREEDILNIVENYGLVVMSRSGEPVTDLGSFCKWIKGHQDRIIIIEKNDFQDIASTTARTMLQDGEDITHIITEGVRKYINENHLYVKHK